MFAFRRERNNNWKNNETEKKELTFGALNWFSVIIMQSFEDLTAFVLKMNIIIYVMQLYVDSLFTQSVLRLKCREKIFSREKNFEDLH